MTAYELLVVAIGGLAGYWLVSFLTKGRRAPPPAPPPAAEPPPVVAPPVPAPWHEVLGVDARADADEVRDAYRRLIAQYHPDKVASLGPELRELAHRKSQQILAAYEAAQRERAGA